MSEEKGELECVICMTVVQHEDALWTCERCGHSLHTECASGIAAFDEDEVTVRMRCPACNHRTTTSSDVFEVEAGSSLCFCGAEMLDLDEKQTAGRSAVEAHSCGGACGRNRMFCIHPVS